MNNNVGGLRNCKHSNICYVFIRSEEFRLFFFQEESPKHGDQTDDNDEENSVCKCVFYFVHFYFIWSSVAGKKSCCNVYSGLRL